MGGQPPFTGAHPPFTGTRENFLPCLRNLHSEVVMNAGKLTAGLALLAIGVLALIDSLDVWNAREAWRYWPVIFIAIGVANEFDALRKRKSENGYVLIGIGAWFLAGFQHWFGLSVGRAFPIFVIVVGLGVLLHALVDRPAFHGKKENAQ